MNAMIDKQSVAVFGMVSLEELAEYEAWLDEQAENFFEVWEHLFSFADDHAGEIKALDAMNPPPPVTIDIVAVGLLS